MKRMFALLLTLLLLCGCATETIGTIRGAEFDEVVIDGVVYVRDDADQFQNYSTADKGAFLGTVTNGEDTFQIYAIEGDSHCLYAQWEQEGMIYVKKPPAETD